MFHMVDLNQVDLYNSASTAVPRVSIVALLACLLESIASLCRLEDFALEF